MIYRIVIPKWRPTALNTLLSKHWAEAARLKKADAAMIAGYAARCEVPKATGKRRVSLEITLTGRQKEVDPDGYEKSTLDGLVKCGMLIDDRCAYCEFGGVTYVRGAEGSTTIVLEDLTH